MRVQIEKDKAKDADILLRAVICHIAGDDEKSLALCRKYTGENNWIGCYIKNKHRRIKGEINTRTGAIRCQKRGTQVSV